MSKKPTTPRSAKKAPPSVTAILPPESVETMSVQAGITPDPDDLLAVVAAKFPTLGAALARQGHRTLAAAEAAIPVDYRFGGNKFATAVTRMIDTGTPYDVNKGRLSPAAYFLAHAATVSAGGGLIVMAAAENIYPEFNASKADITARIDAQSEAFIALINKVLPGLRSGSSPYKGDNPSAEELATAIRASKAVPKNKQEECVSKARGLYSKTARPVADGYITENAHMVVRALKIKTKDLAEALPGVILTPASVAAQKPEQRKRRRVVAAAPA